MSVLPVSAFGVNFSVDVEFIANETEVVLVFCLVRMDVDFQLLHRGNDEVSKYRFSTVGVLSTGGSRGVCGYSG